MEPTTNHERAIAQAVDEKFRQDPSVSLGFIVSNIVVSLDFLMCASDSRFLVLYSQWRSGHPEAP